MWPKYPRIYEVNTWVWLSELSLEDGRRVELGSVSPAKWDAIAALGFDAVWLMGVWERSPAGMAIANSNSRLQQDFQRALQDYAPQDNVGSPYCVRQYRVDEHLGGPEGLKVARKQLAARGIRLVLDFVPNHVAPDHLWATEHPEYFIQGSADELRRDAGAYVDVNGKAIACGKDPYFPAWPDVLQLNAFNSGLRTAAKATLASIANQCDAVRCDMEMLMINSVFERTWGDKAGTKPSSEYWVDLIAATKRTHRDFLFIAEAYWDLEWELQQQGFDFCYDKRLYDRLEHANAESVRLHLRAEPAYQSKLLRFLENHDEPRAATTFSPAKERALAVVTSTLPGARLFHEGQFEGRKVRLPVFLARRPQEPVDKSLQDFYMNLVLGVRDSSFRDGDWTLCDCTGWFDNRSFENVVAWTWKKDENRYLIVVNLSDSRSQALVRVTDNALRGREWQLNDELSGRSYQRSGDEMSSPGLYVDLQPWGYHIFRFSQGADDVPMV
jgi:hypothetical protein